MGTCSSSGKSGSTSTKKGEASLKSMLKKKAFAYFKTATSAGEIIDKYKGY